MKNWIYLAICMLGLTVHAQKQLEEGVIVSKQAMSSDNEQMNAQLAMLGEMVTTTYFKNNKSRSETDHPMAGSTVYIADAKANKSLVLMDNPMLGRKYVQGVVTPSAEDLEGIKVEKTNETKNILGYDCTRYNVTMNKDGADVKMAVYTTDKLNAITQQTAAFGTQVTGFPLLMDFDIEQQGVKLNLKVEVTDIKGQAVADDKFSLTPPEGYSKADSLPTM